MKKYLEPSEFIDWQHSDVKDKASMLAAQSVSRIEVAQQCFEFVRDKIKHSTDFGLSQVTAKASEVLHHETGVCYAKSHLLAALLRANGIPAALHYQRLKLSDGVFCLHGLNSIWLDEFGWYRVDARGNKPEVAAEFCPPVEKLAFALSELGEVDSRERYASPIQVVIDGLCGASSVEELDAILPDDSALI